MSAEENKLGDRRSFEEMLHNGTVSGSDELGAASEDETLERKLSGWHSRSPRNR